MDLTSSPSVDKTSEISHQQIQSPEIQPQTINIKHPATDVDTRLSSSSPIVRSPVTQPSAANPQIDEHESAETLSNTTAANDSAVGEKAWANGELKDSGDPGVGTPASAGTTASTNVNISQDDPNTPAKETDSSAPNSDPGNPCGILFVPDRSSKLSETSRTTANESTADVLKDSVQSVNAEPVSDIEIGAMQMQENTQQSSAATASACSRTPTTSQTDPADQIYHIKWIQYGENKTPVVTQNENGPCPLLAIMNVLLVRGQVRLPDDAVVVTGQQLMHRLGDCILRLAPENLAETLQADYEANVSDAVGMLSKLMTGLDVNVRFTGISDFEYTGECIVFDLLGIPLYHGWLVDPIGEKEVAMAVLGRSYNQLVELIINHRHGETTDNISATQAAMADQFLEVTASQLTYHGLCELNRNLKDGELAVFFRNNHFATMLKNRDELFLLVTDQGFLEETGVVWETLNSVDGDSHFVDAFFHTPSPHNPPSTTTTNNEQIDKDYLMALSLEQEERASLTQTQTQTTVPSNTQPARPNQQATQDTRRPAPSTPAALPEIPYTRKGTPGHLEGDALLAWQLQQEEDNLAATAAESVSATEGDRRTPPTQLTPEGVTTTSRHSPQRQPQHQFPPEKDSKCSIA